MPQPSNVDPREIDKFNQLGSLWWDPRGPMHSLHTVNPLRAAFIASIGDLQDGELLDVGCGAGILTEALAKLGARVTAIDLSEDVLELARRHASAQGLKIDYRFISAEQLAEQQPATFDIVTCMEVLEHIPEPRRVVAACSQLLKPGGHAFFSTIDRSLKSFVFAIFGAEYILRLLPRGSHRYGALIRPAELRSWAASSGLSFAASASLLYNPFTSKFKLADVEDVNYLMRFTKV